jgi:S-adenosylmethionine uptake transporter
MLAGSGLFAVMATCVSLAHRHDPTLSTAVTSAVRAGVNLLLLVVLSARDPRALLGDGRAALWARGVFGGVAMLTYFAALETLSAGEAAFLNQTSAVWVALGAPLLLGERVGGVAWAAVLGSVGGVALLAHPREADGFARFLGLFSGLSAAAAYLSIRRAGTTNGPRVVVFYFTLVSTVLAVTVALATGAPLPRDAVTLALLTAAGVSATFAQLLMTEAYRVGRAAPVAAAGAASPLITTLLAWLVLGQVPDVRALAGMGVLCVTGVAMPFYAGR